jgi:hypothetical protein
MITATVLTENTESDASQVESLLEESLQKEEGGSGGSGGSKSDNDGLLAAYEPMGPTIPSVPARPSATGGPRRSFPHNGAQRSKSTGTLAGRLCRAMRRSATSILTAAGNGRKKWKRTRDYHRRSLTETAFIATNGLWGGLWKPESGPTKRRRPNSARRC